ncbi:parallel beta-helix domain-containing protein [Pseudoxanthomonas dokdonensis]|nr:parallel beta-helix domain-containing protein [Pseudoxanthomonas dokdonensis]
MEGRNKWQPGRTLAMAAALLAVAGCGREQQPPAAASGADADFSRTLHQRLLDAKPGDVIEIPAGTFHFDRSLSLRADGVTIRGAGMDQSVLSFKGQKAGAEGLLVNGNDFTIENLTIEDSKGDGLKVSESENITIRKVKVQWTGGPSTKNGGYGLYPVLTKNVLIEDSVAIGASDAGIYVGQSDGVIVRRSRAEQNVAGIEVENTINADVYDNIATHNTGGILVFNMPGLSQQGGNIRVYNNRILANNTGNFGAKGTPVASVPAGSGIVVNSNDDIEIFGNQIVDNDTASIIISSVYSTGYKDSSKSETFDPYPERIYIHDNTISGGGGSPDGMDLKALKVAMYGLTGNLPDVLWDGYQNPELAQKGKLNAAQICLKGVNGVLNADGPNGYKNPSNGMAPFNCELPALPAIDLGRG